jgi:hypothetical protein
MDVIFLEDLIGSLPGPIDQLIKKGLGRNATVKDFLFAGYKYSGH